jgi:hypothetical protein
MVGYDLNDAWHLPDFWLPGLGFWLEVRLGEPTDEEKDLCRRLSDSSGRTVHMAIGAPEPRDQSLVFSPSDSTRFSFPEHERIRFYFADDRRNEGEFWLLSDAGAASSIGPRTGPDHGRYPGLYGATRLGYEAARGARFNGSFRIARTHSAPPAENSAKGTHWGDVVYHDRALSGQVTFNYSNNNGRYSIGRDELFFETMWSKASDRSIYLYSDPPSIAGVAEAPELQSYEKIGDPANYDMSSRVRAIQKGEHAILKNRYNNYAVLRIIDIKDRTRSDSVDVLTFEYWILADVASSADAQGSTR